MWQSAATDGGVNRTPSHVTFSRVCALVLICHITLAQLFVRVISSLFHAPVCLFDLSSNLSSHSSFVSPIFYFIHLIIHFIFHVDRFGARSPVYFAERGVWPFGQQRPSHTRIGQEIEELRRRCNKEENGVTRQKLNDYSIQHDQESRTVNLLRDQFRKLQERLEFIEDSKIFQDPDSPSSLGSAHVSHQAFIPSSSRKPGRESRMQRDTLGDISIPGNVFDCHFARRVPEELNDDSRNLATSSGIHGRDTPFNLHLSPFTFF